LIKNAAFAFIIFFLLFGKSYSSDLNKIIHNIQQLNTIKFNFIQNINDKTEMGNCTLAFSGKLKCFYDDKNKKELVVNDNQLAISQKRYNKTFFYPLKRSYFKKILDKQDFIKIISQSKKKVRDEQIHLIYKKNEINEITFLFDKNSFFLEGWKTTDQFNNEILFEIKILENNFIVSDDFFKIPSLN
tara:strand:+ start:780 stop:1340 length:561 start_codon:yes stop_codon:yes gene_type:complete